MSGKMMLKSLTVLGSLLAMAPSAASHMIMAEPKPFGSPNNSPLDPSGSDYPCKATDSASGPMNEFKVGENSTLSFTGSAVHGGGSCQLAVTTDKNPTKDSKFKVIYSIEGGCPGVGSPSQFSFQVPEELPNGEATFAWTWFNKIGNREMYMNCARITVSGGKDDTKAFEGLPDMAVANIQAGGGASCKTAESSDYTFKDAGKYVQKIGSGPFVELCGGAASGGAGGSGPSPGGNSPEPAPAAPGGGSGNNGMYTPQPAAPQVGATQAPAPAAPSAPPASEAAPSAAPSATGAPSADPAPPALTSTVSTLVTVTSGGAGQPTAAPTAAPAPAPPTGAPAAGGNTCSTNGEIVCNGEQQFGICNQGTVVWQGVAAGTKCQNGKIAKRDFTHRNQRTAVVDH